MNKRQHCLIFTHLHKPIDQHKSKHPLYWVNFIRLECCALFHMKNHTRTHTRSHTRTRTQTGKLKKQKTAQTIQEWRFVFAFREEVIP